MNTVVKTKQLILAVGDVFILYLSLALTLVIRYDQPFDGPALGIHLVPFTYIFIVWMVVFFIIGLYEIRYLKNNIDFLRKFGAAIAINAAIAIAIFYVTPLGIAPKTNLFILLALFSLLEYFWRLFYNRFLSAGAPTANVLLIGSGDAAKEIEKQVKQNPQLGYEIKFWMKEGLSDKEIEHMNQIIITEKINLIVIPLHLKKDSRAARVIYKNLALGIETVDTASFYENIFSKVPLSELEEVWFLENLVNRRRIYEAIKQPIEIVAALALAIITLPLFLLIAFFIKITSAGPALFKQTRVGQHEAEFTLYKFRTMIKDAEKSGAQWSKPGDSRVTPLGKILRHSHLDELPQFINIIKGELSFVGPRPERPEFTEKLKKEIPHYQLRHLVRPGITGWAQLNYRYGASVADAHEKLQYEIFYLKNKSFWLDLGIVLKTIKLFFVKN